MTTKTPIAIQTYTYASEALAELRHLISESKGPTNAKLIFQALPRHMRRRAMSHNPNRLPRALRKAHIAQSAKAGLPEKKRRPARKWRRRPRNLRQEYARRARRIVWLETHIWHARRFRMVERWGYKLAYVSNDKTYRACYRATKDYCLLQDISYLCCLQLQAPVELISKGFERLTSKDCGLSITAATFLSGRREGSIQLFRDNKYPYGALAEVQFMWRPLEDNEVQTKNRTLWLWLHPVIYTTMLEQLIKIFSLVKKNICQQAANKLHCNSYSSECGAVELLELKQQLNRFRLTGPLTQQVLHNALRPIKANMQPQQWYKKFVEQAANYAATHAEQAEYWQTMSQLVNTPSQLMSNLIMSLNIEDPRLYRASKRSKPEAVPVSAEIPESSNKQMLIMSPPKNLPAASALWCGELRQELSNSLVSTQALNKLRQSNLAVPGAKSLSSEHALLQPLPLLLIQRPGSQNAQYKRLGYGCGWDIIAPAGTGMHIWLSLVMWGARVGALRETETLMRESGHDAQLPDTLLATRLAAEHEITLKHEYFRLPSGKRINYHKLSICSPFRIPFAHLVHDWQTSEAREWQSEPKLQKFHVLRNRAQLYALYEYMEQHKSGGTYVLFREIPTESVIQIYIKLNNRGNLTEYSLLCLPEQQDYKKYKRQYKTMQHEPIFTQPAVKDKNEFLRKHTRIGHRQLLKRLRARRVREKRKLQETSTQRVHIRAANTKQLCEKHQVYMRELWLPDLLFHLNELPVRQQCAREVLGYVNSASFCLTEGIVCAVGYITVLGLKKLFNSPQPHSILVRNKNTHSFYFATYKINKDLKI